MYDLIIRNGFIIDGTGDKGFRGDIAVKDGLIAEIAPCIKAEAAEVLEAEGLTVTPGFIDCHSHSDAVILLGTDGYNMLEQGITTQITGHCGTGPTPYYPGLFENIRQSHGEEKARELAEICATYKSFMAAAEKLDLGTNMAFYAPQGNIRGKVMGFKMGEPDDEELEAMKKLMAEAMEAGYIGFTTGLVYAPSIYAGTRELVELAKVAHSYGGNYTSHIRGEGCHVLDAMKEAIYIGEQSGIPVIISHLKIKGRQYEGASVDMLKLIDDSCAKGLTVWADQYPFTASCAPLISQIPPQFAEGGNNVLLERMKDEKLRAEMERCIFEDYETYESNIFGAGYEGVLISGAHYTPEYVGRYVADIAREEGKKPFDVVCDMLIANNGVVQAIYFSQNESDMLRIIKHPRVMAGCDATDNPVHQDPEKTGGNHPRATCTMTRRIQLIRDNGLLSPEAAVRNLTGLAADTAGLEGIGYLKKGKRADICVLDYDNVRGNADYIHPYRRNEGVEYVFVGGRKAVDHGVFTGVRNGIVLKGRGAR